MFVVVHYVGSVWVIAVVCYLSIRRVCLVLWDLVVRMLDLMILVLYFKRIFLYLCHRVHPPMIKWLEVPPRRVVPIKMWLGGPGWGGIDSSWECVDWVVSHLGMGWPSHVGRQSVEIVGMLLLWHMVQIMLRLWQVGVDQPCIG